MNSRTIQFSRGEAEALLILMHHAGVYSMDISNSESPALKEVYGDLPIAARRQIVGNLNRKIWQVWADTHPEEGPFK